MTVPLPCHAVDYRAEKDCVFFSINGNFPNKNPKNMKWRPDGG
jgi:hypothetical protein